ncbi:ESAG-like protein [Trypanosoma grayi]|uniref:ESAG-like protein n=1 Tax=Trypanosoma grayi TaxID=71804 RepID=UPI0004F48785|nr:ESAG-like protein [Trypanosoma grayi]KEG11365.1 ESAG-like protein [Trypanosoma grayi]
MPLKRFAPCSFFLLVATALECVVVCSGRLTGFTGEMPRLRGLSPGATFAMEEAFFTNTIPLLRPQLNEFLKHVAIPAQHTDKFDIDEIHFSKLGIGDAAISMVSPDQLLMSIQNVSAIVPDTNFVIKVGFATCNGRVRVSIDNTNASLPASVFRMSNGTLQWSIGENAIQWGPLNITHSLDGAACKAIETIVEVLLGNLDSIIRASLEKELPKRVGPIVEEKVNEIFTTLPLIFTSDPSIMAKRMELEMDVVPDPSENRTRTPLKPASLGLQVSDRNFESVVLPVAINNLLTYLCQMGKLNVTETLPAEYNSSLIEPMYPDTYKMCRDCPFAVSAHATVPPSVELRSDQTAILHLPNGFISLEMLSTTGIRVPVLDVAVNVTAGATHIGFTPKARLDFNLTKVDLKIDVVASNIGTIDVFQLNSDLLWLLNEVMVPLFNVQFEGIALPAVVSRPLLNITTENVTLGFDVKCCYQ